MKEPVLRTSDLAKRIGVQPDAIRYYERRGLLPLPQRGSSGYRIYTTQHLERVEFIKQCQTLGFSLDEIRELMELKFRGGSPCHHVRDLLLQKIKEVEAQIERMTFFKQELHGSCTDHERNSSRQLCVRGQESIRPLLPRRGKQSSPEVIIRVEIRHGYFAYLRTGEVPCHIGCLFSQWCLYLASMERNLR
jgi:DNA-binding transcriptional MerR regulator